MNETLTKHQLNAINQRLTEDEFINRCKAIHHDTYDYSKTFFTGTKKKIVVTCKAHGDFDIIAQAHYNNKQGCPTCFRLNRLGFINVSILHKDLMDTHQQLYTYIKSTLEVVIKKAKILPIGIICKEHGIFYQSVRDHLNGKVCPTCAKNNKSKKISKCNQLRTKTIEEFINDARKIHGERYNYDKTIYVRGNSSIIITCDIHGDFQQIPKNHLNGNGCQKCASGSTSIMEHAWLDSLNVPKKQRQKWITINKKRIRVDAYDKKTNTVYEFFGDFWHGNPDNSRYHPNDINPKNKKTYRQLYENTLDRIELIKMGNYQIEYIWEYDWLYREKNNED